MSATTKSELISPDKSEIEKEDNNHHHHHHNDDDTDNNNKKDDKNNCLPTTDSLFKKDNTETSNSNLTLPVVAQESSSSSSSLKGSSSSSLKGSSSTSLLSSSSTTSSSSSSSSSNIPTLSFLSNNLSQSGNKLFQSKIIPKTFVCWVHIGEFIKDEIIFENVWKYNHLRPIIRLQFGIEQLSPYIQLYSDSSLNISSFLDPETIIDSTNIPKHLYIKILTKQQIQVILQSTVIGGGGGGDAASSIVHDGVGVGGINSAGEVRVFLNDKDQEPKLIFENGIDINTIEKNFHIISGWLKRKGDNENKRVRSPFRSGDYVLVGAIPIFKTVTIVYHGFISYFDKKKKLKIKFQDTPDEIKVKITNLFRFRPNSNIQLLDLSENLNVDINYFDLLGDKVYELLVPWF